ncbi:hypothetical protein HZS_651 [Henneguya salminicola]|nr:hypothetical protein HZS_651 [Henneguya salminicola]
MKKINHLLRKFSNHGVKTRLYPSYNNPIKFKWAEGTSSTLNKHDFIFPVFVRSLKKYKLSSESNELTEIQHLPLNYRLLSCPIRVNFPRPFMDLFGLDSIVILRFAASSSCGTPIRRNQLPIGAKGLAMRAIVKVYRNFRNAISSKFPNYPLFVYHVSGECAMLHYASEMGAIDFDCSLKETLIAFKRAGATGIITYTVPQLLDYFE